jgi:hypothetical protein
MNYQILEEVSVLCHQDEIDLLERHARRRLSGRVRDFRLLLTECGLVLQGTALTYHEKQIAQHAIMEATRLPILANEIEVAPFTAPS